MTDRSNFHNIYRTFLKVILTISFFIINGTHTIAQNTKSVNCKDLYNTYSWNEVFSIDDGYTSNFCNPMDFPLNTGAWISYFVPPVTDTSREDWGCKQNVPCRKAQAEYFLNNKWTALPLWSEYILFNTVKYWVPPELLGSTIPWRWTSIHQIKNGEWRYGFQTNTFYMPKTAMTSYACFSSNCPPQL